MKVALLPLGEVAGDVLDPLAASLRGTGIACVARGAAALPSDAFVPAKGQWDAERVLRGLPRSPPETVLAITEADLFVEGLNFVFGLADTPGGAALVSVARLRSRDRAVAQRRLLKEVVHELGHTLGIAHCPDRACVMHFSSSLADTDAKGVTPCPKCADLLRADEGAAFARFGGAPRIP